MNRDNFRRDVFETNGAAMAFETMLGEACVRNAWISAGSSQIVDAGVHASVKSLERSPRSRGRRSQTGSYLIGFFEIGCFGDKTESVSDRLHRGEARELGFEPVGEVNAAFGLVVVERFVKIPLNGRMKLQRHPR